MKAFFIIFFFTILGVTLSSQNKQDYYWPLGIDVTDEPEVEGSAFDFNKRPFTPEERRGDLEMDMMNASICDAEGNLLFYTNGCAVSNREHKIMPEGDSINAGPFLTEYWREDCSLGYTGVQDITILPDPAYDLGFYILHKPNTYDVENDRRFTKDTLQYSYVDMALDNGLGDVTEKNVNITEHHMLNAYLTSIPKENGRDWWVINAVHPSGYMLWSLTEEGIQYERELDGPEWDEWSGAAGYGLFSPNGTKYALFNEFDGVHLYDFDRSDASFSNAQHLPPGPRPDSGTFSTSEWSPNSRFLYLARADSLWQLDTEAEPLIDGLVFIAEKTDPEVPWFQKAALGPDCRIYLRQLSSHEYMNIIHKPDEKGLACDFQQMGIKLPRITGVGTFPNVPRFRVDEEDKCDPSIVSIVGETVWWRRDLEVYPNPASTQVTVTLPEQQQGRLYIMDISGVVVQDHIAVLSDKILDVSGLVPGTYSVEFLPEDNEDRVVYTRKVVVVR